MTGKNKQSFMKTETIIHGFYYISAVNSAVARAMEQFRHEVAIQLSATTTQNVQTKVRKDGSRKTKVDTRDAGRMARSVVPGCVGKIGDLADFDDELSLTVTKQPTAAEVRRRLRAQMVEQGIEPVRFVPEEPVLSDSAGQMSTNTVPKPVNSGNNSRSLLPGADSRSEHIGIMGAGTSTCDAQVPVDQPSVSESGLQNTANAGETLVQTLVRTTTFQHNENVPVMVSDPNVASCSQSNVDEQPVGDGVEEPISKNTVSTGAMTKAVPICAEEEPMVHEPCAVPVEASDETAIPIDTPSPGRLVIDMDRSANVTPKSTDIAQSGDQVPVEDIINQCREDDMLADGASRPLVKPPNLSAVPSTAQKITLISDTIELSSSDDEDTEIRFPDDPTDEYSRAMNRVIDEPNPKRTDGEQKRSTKRELLMN